MRIISFLLLAPVAFAGTVAKSPTGACSLIPSATILQLFGETVSNAKPVPQTSGNLIHSQCFYSLPTFINSISLSVTAPKNHGDAARELWEHLFHGEGGDNDHDADKSEEREEGAKAVPVPRLGDEAYWVHSFVGNLYVLKGDVFLRISIGGKLTDEERQKRAKALALAVLSNLKPKR